MKTFERISKVTIYISLFLCITMMTITQYAIYLDAREAKDEVLQFLEEEVRNTKEVQS